MIENFLLQNKYDEIVSYHIPRNILLIHGDEPEVTAPTYGPDAELLPYRYIVESAKGYRVFTSSSGSSAYQLLPGKFGTAHANATTWTGGYAVGYLWDAPVWLGDAFNNPPLWIGDPIYDPGLFNFGNGPWTVDFWVLMDIGEALFTMSYDHYAFYTWDAGILQRSWLEIDFGRAYDGFTWLYCGVLNTNMPFLQGTVPPEALDVVVDIEGINIVPGSWNHIAVVCEKIAETSPTNRVRIYFNGVMFGSALTTLNFTRLRSLDPNNSYFIPHRLEVSNYLDSISLLDEIRIAPRAIWTENFTPPTEPYK